MEKTGMHQAKLGNKLSRKLAGKVCLLGGVSLFLWTTGCGGSSSSVATAPQQPKPQTYLAPGVAYTTIGSPANISLETFTLDDSKNSFSETKYLQLGPQVFTYGNFTAMPNGLLNLGILASYSPSPTNDGSYVATPYSPAQTGSVAIELSGQVGGFVQLVGKPVTPLVAAVSCPNLATPQTWQYVTIPAALFISSSGEGPDLWNPTAETAYGSVDISTNGDTVKLDNIKQFTLPSVGGSGLPAVPVGSPVMANCGPTFYGNTISVPNPLIITDPGQGGGEIVQPSAVMGIGPTGLLVEDNGNGSHGTFSSAYQNALGAGTGAVGLPKPLNPLDTGALVGAQYRGFVYGAGFYGGNSTASTGWSSHIVSFGFSTVPPSCASVAASTSTLIYGVDYSNDDPSSPANGVGSCDFAIDLGTQDAPGLYSHATVSIGAGYTSNVMGKTYSFSAVAIAGQLKGKNAIFLLGVDSTQPWVPPAQPWAIYLLQSN